MEADRLDGLFAARADAGDDVVRVFADGAARRLGGLGESIGDRIAMEADRFDRLFAARADAGDDVVRVLADGAARRRRGLGESVGDRVAMEADRLDGLFAACADASDDLVRELGDGAAGRRGSLGKSIGDRVAMEADRRDGLFAACADAATTSSAYSATALRVPEAWEVDQRRSPWSGSPRRPVRRFRCTGDDVVRVFGDGAASPEACASWSATDRPGRGSRPRFAPRLR